MSRSGRKACRMSGSGQKSIPNVREWSGVPPGCPGVVGVPTRCLGVVGRPSRMSGSGRETFPNVPEGWEALPDVREALLVARE